MADRTLCPDCRRLIGAGVAHAPGCRAILLSGGDVIRPAVKAETAGLLNKIKKVCSGAGVRAVSATKAVGSRKEDR